LIPGRVDGDPIGTWKRYFHESARLEFKFLVDLFICFRLRFIVF